jgi:hypothetical protein
MLKFQPRTMQVSVCVPRSGDGAVGLVFSETDAEIVLHRETTIPSVEVHYLVDDVVVAVTTMPRRGANTVAPFDDHTGKCKVIRDPSA